MEEGGEAVEEGVVVVFGATTAAAAGELEDADDDGVEDVSAVLVWEEL